MRWIGPCLVAITVGLGLSQSEGVQAQQAPKPQRGPGPAEVSKGTPPRTGAPPVHSPKGATPRAASALDPQLSKLLEEWAEKTRSISTLRVRMTRQDDDAVWGPASFQGDAIFQRPNLVYLNFDKLPEPGTGGKVIPHERIVCSGDKVYQFLPETRQLHVYPLPKAEQQKMVEEGPLPFLFDLDAAKAKARYQMKIANQNDEVCLISIKPLDPADREAFSLAYVWLSKTQKQPTQIWLYDGANPKNVKKYVFKSVTPNVKIDPTWFNGEAQWAPLKKAQPPWDLVVHEPEAPGAQPVSGSTPKGTPAARTMQPAARPAAPRR